MWFDRTGAGARMGGGFRGLWQSLSLEGRSGTIVEANTDLAVIEDDEGEHVDVQSERAGYVLELLFEEDDEVNVYVPVIKLGVDRPRQRLRRRNIWKYDCKLKF